MFMPVSMTHGHGVKKARKLTLRMRGVHADMVEKRIKDFQIRFSAIKGANEIHSGMILTVNRMVDKFSLHSVVCKGEALVTGIFPIMLTFNGIYIPRMERFMSRGKLNELSYKDACNSYDEMATYYLTRRAAYFNFPRWQPIKDRVLNGYMVTWRYF